MNLRQTISLYGSGTREGALLAWETRERGKKSDMYVTVDENADDAISDAFNGMQKIGEAPISRDDFVKGFTFEHPDYNVSSLSIDTVFSRTAGNRRTNDLVINGRITDSKGTKVGWFERRIDLDRMNVHHNSFFLDEHTQGKGIAAALMEQSINLYKKARFSNVVTFADGDVGKYCWALTGFDFAQKATLNYAKRRFKDYLDTKLEGGYMTNAWAKSFDVDKFEHSWDFARFEIDGVKYGKDFMLSKMGDWDGIMKLDDSSPDQVVFNTYLEKSKVKKSKKGIAAAKAKMGDHNSEIFHREILDNEDEIIAALNDLFG